MALLREEFFINVKNFLLIYMMFKQNVEIKAIRKLFI